MLCPNCHSQTNSYCKRFIIRDTTVVKMETLDMSAQEEIFEVEQP